MADRGLTVTRCNVVIDHCVWNVGKYLDLAGPIALSVFFTGIYRIPELLHWNGMQLVTPSNAYVFVCTGMKLHGNMCCIRSSLIV